MDELGGIGPLLIVDDNVSMTNALQLVFAGLGLETVVAHDVSDAIALLDRRNDWCGLLVDMCMPGGAPSPEPAGIQVALYARGRDPGRPCMMFTAHYRAANYAARHQLPLLRKPCGPEDLRAFVAGCIDRARARSWRVMDAVSPSRPPGETKTSVDVAALERLSSTERRTLQARVDGHTVEETLRLLSRSRSTYEKHVTRILQVMGGNRMAEVVAAVRAHERGSLG